MGKRTRIILLAVCASLHAAGGMAAEAEDSAPVPVVIGSDVSTDSLGTWTGFLSSDVGVTDSVWLFAGLGRSESPSDQLNLNTTTYEGGFSVDVTEGFQFDAAYETWGNSDDISTRELALGLKWRGDGWRFSLDPALRRITLHAGAPAQTDTTGDGGGGPTLPTIPGPGGGPPGGPGGDPTDPGNEVLAEDFQLQDRSLALSASWDAGETDHWWFRGGAGFHSYTEDPALLGTRDSLERFSATSLTLAQGFRDWSVWGEAEYRFDRQSIYITLARDRSAVDGIKSDTVSLGYLTPLGEQWDFFATLGATDANGFDRTEFLTVGITWYR